jgi:hypothetical protein
MLEKLHVVENESLTSAGHGMAWQGTTLQDKPQTHLNMGHKIRV